MTMPNYIPLHYVPTMDDIRKVTLEIEKETGIKVTRDKIRWVMDGSLEFLTVSGGVIYEIEGLLSRHPGFSKNMTPSTEFTNAIDVYRGARVWANMHDFNTSKYDNGVAIITKVFNSIPINPSTGTSIRGG